MILNVSGRTDIVAFYMEWFWKRYQEGFVDVKNPFYPKKVSRILFKDVDAIIFCTKNPIPALPYLKKIKQPILFHITLTPYKDDIEPNVPPKGKIINAIKEISTNLGKDRIYIRYDPIFINNRYDLDYHIKSFDKLCSLLKGYTSHIIVSFLDNYKNVRKNKEIINSQLLTQEDYKKIGISFSKSAKENEMTVQTCFEENNLVEYSFIKQDCFTEKMAFSLTGKTNFKRWKARGCNCIEMVDIGEYNTCLHLCKYCYANYDEEQVKKKYLQHNKSSSVLIGNLADEEIRIRKK